MRVSRALLIVDSVCVGFLLFLYGRDVSDYIRAQSAPISAMTELPLLWFAIPVILAALATGGGVLHGLIKRREETWRGFRIPPIVAVVVLFIDLLVLGHQRVPISSADQSAIALHVASQMLTPLVTAQGVPTDPSQISSVIANMGAPPFLVRGKRPDRFSVQVRTGCVEPIGEVPGAQPATFIYCSSADRRIAWLTLVALPVEKRFGAPEIFSRDGVVQTTVVQQPPPEDNEPAPSSDEPSGALEEPPAR